jgi:hypothetical protein
MAVGYPRADVPVVGGDEIFLVQPASGLENVAFGLRVGGVYRVYHNPASFMVIF